jgi:NAD+ diphosphatase
MKRYLFVGQDIVVPARPGSGDPGWEGLSLGAAAPGGTSPLSFREYEEDGTRYAALMLSEEGAAEAISSAPARGEEARRLSLREALASFPAPAMRPALRGIALLRWLEGARFCGACGSPLEDKEAGSEDYGGRACTSCGRLHFPRISPAVIVLIRKGPRALLAHNARFRPGFFGLIAGFVEAGETLEEAAIREAREEAGIEIANLRYVKSQPWPFPDSLMLAFTADWVSGEARPDGVEIGELRWCLPTELPEIPPKGSVARYLIDEFVKGS